jgi:transposase
MSRYLLYSPDQALLLPASVRDVLGADHLCFFVHEMVEKLDLSRFHAAYAKEGGPLYHPSLMLKLWLYAYALGVTSSHRLEQRTIEDLAFRYLAGGAQPDFWALNHFRRRHRLAINDCFTQVVELAARLGMRQLGTVAVDTTRIKASASPDKVVLEKRRQRARVRRKVRSWQQSCDADDSNEGAGMQVEVSAETVAAEAVGAELEPLEKPRKRSRTDPDARFLRTRQGFTLGYSAQIAVSEDHLIVAQRVVQEGNDNHTLLPMVELVRSTCGGMPQRVVADSGFYSNQNVEALQQQGIEAYVPDSNLARELNLGHPAKEPDHPHGCLNQMRSRMRSPQGRQIYRQRKGMVEPPFGTMKEQRGMRAFRMRGLDKVGIEFALSTTAHNLVRMHRRRGCCGGTARLGCFRCFRPHAPISTPPCDLA